MALHAQLQLRPKRSPGEEKCIYSGRSKCEEEGGGGRGGFLDRGEKTGSVARDHVTGVCERGLSAFARHFKEQNDARPPRHGVTTAAAFTGSWLDVHTHAHRERQMFGASVITAEWDVL